MKRLITSGEASSVKKEQILEHFPNLKAEQVEDMTTEFIEVSSSKLNIH